MTAIESFNYSPSASLSVRDNTLEGTEAKSSLKMHILWTYKAKVINDIQPNSFQFETTYNAAIVTNLVFGSHPLIFILSHF